METLEHLAHRLVLKNAWTGFRYSSSAAKVVLESMSYSETSAYAAERQATLWDWAVKDSCEWILFC